MSIELEYDDRIKPDAMSLTDNPCLKQQGFGLWALGKSIPPDRDGLTLQQALRDEWPD